jgi:transcriptional regulator with XRE-family HTH domain
MGSGAKDKLRTSTLLRRLFKASDLDTYLLNNKDDVRVPSFVEHINELCEEKGMVREHVIKRSGIERSFGYQLLRGARQPSRDNVIRLAVGLLLSVDEAQELLRIARKSVLYPKIKRDAAILFCIARGKDMIEVQALLSAHGLTLLGGERYDYAER